MSLSASMYADNFVVTISSAGVLDEVSWNIKNPSNVIVASGNGYDFGSTNTINVSVTGGSFTFYIESIGAEGDNTPSYSVTCPGGGTTYVSGTLVGGTDFTSSSFAAVSSSGNISLSSAVGTNSQNSAVYSAITNITYSTTVVTGATFSGLPDGVTGSWAANAVTISGTPTVVGTFAYTVNLIGGCEGGNATGTITVTSITPAVGSFAPTSGCAGTSVTITGTNFMGATAVSVGGVAVTSFMVNSSTEISAMVGSGTITGMVSVTTPNGMGSSSVNFAINALPSSPTTSDKCTFSSSVNLVATGTGTVEWFNNNSHTGSPLASGTNTAAYSTTLPGNYYAFMNDGGCYSNPTTATATIRNSVLPIDVPIGQGTYYATDIVMDGGVNHYCNCPNNTRILSLSSSFTANSATLDTDGSPSSSAYSVRAEVGSGYLATLSSPPYNGLLGSTGWKVINRTWEVVLGDSMQEPTSAVGVISYFTIDEYSAVNADLNADLNDPSEMTIYKLKNNPYASAMAALAAGHALIDTQNIYLFNNQSNYTAHWVLGSISPSIMSSTYSVNEFSGGGGGGGDGGGVPFPVKLTSFSGYNNGFSNVLNWVTATELNNKAFEVLRSVDGVIFETIGIVNSQATNGNSNGNLSYQFTDKSLLTQNYYKLKQIDIDGRVSMLPQIVEIALGENFKTAINLFPNPTTNELNVAITGVLVNNYLVEVSDIYGKTISSVQQLSNGGTNISTINVSNLAQGTYIVTVKDRTNSIVSTQRFVKE